MKNRREPQRKHRSLLHAAGVLAFVAFAACVVIGVTMAFAVGVSCLIAIGSVPLAITSTLIAVLIAWAIAAGAKRSGLFGGKTDAEENSGRNDTPAPQPAEDAEGQTTVPDDAVDEPGSPAENPPLPTFQLDLGPTSQTASRPGAISTSLFDIPQPQKADERANTPSAMKAQDLVETTHRMLSHSNDVFATAKDLAKTGKSVDAFKMVSEMLARSDALKHPDPPTIRPIRLSRNGRTWLGSDVALATDATYDAVISLEAAFNLNDDMLMADATRPGHTGRSTAEKACHAIAESSTPQPDYRGKIDYSIVAYGGDVPDESEWALRERIANAAENAPLPFRTIFDMKTNAHENIAVVSLEIPRPTCFSIISEDKGTQEALARDYAFRSSLFMVKNAFGAMRMPGPKHAVVTCHTRGDATVRLSMDATSHDLPALEAAAAKDAPMPLPSLPNLRMSCQNDWLDEVDPHIDFDDPLLNPQLYTDPAETSKQECSPLLGQATNSQMESELGTFEGAAKQQAWANLEGRLGTTAESAVSAVKHMQDQSPDPTVQDACDRVMRALVDGTANPEDVDELGRIFGGYAHLEETLQFCTQAYTSRDGNRIEQAARRLEDAITPMMQLGTMDDTETVFRYFRNTAERLSYNLYTTEKRRVHLVSRAYYNANEMMAYLLTVLDRGEEALPYAEEITRIAPISANAAVTKARVLERQLRVFEAMDVINDVIPKCATVSDAALCYYRMAYLQWNMGSHDAAVACYGLCIALHTDITHQAQAELEELLQSDDALKGLSVVECLKVLEREQINVWPAFQRGEEITRAAVLCTDEGLYGPAQSLSLSLLEFIHDDALIDLCHSFSPSE